MREAPSALSHDVLLRSVATAATENEREMLLEEVRRRLEGTREPREPTTPWYAGNGGC